MLALFIDKLIAIRLTKYLKEICMIYCTLYFAYFHRSMATLFFDISKQRIVCRCYSTCRYWTSSRPKITHDEAVENKIPLLFSYSNFFFCNFIARRRNIAKGFATKHREHDRWNANKERRKTEKKASKGKKGPLVIGIQFSKLQLPNSKKTSDLESRRKKGKRREREGNKEEWKSCGKLRRVSFDATIAETDGETYGHYRCFPPY